MKHKVAELEGALLDAAVAKAEGRKDDRPLTSIGQQIEGWREWRPSRCWTDGGPIIERERIEINISEREEGWWANLHGEISRVGVGAWGPTPLIAAMRAYIASRFGEEVELP